MNLKRNECSLKYELRKGISEMGLIQHGRFHFIDIWTATVELTQSQNRLKTIWNPYTNITLFFTINAVSVPLQLLYYKMRTVQRNVENLFAILHDNESVFALDFNITTRFDFQQSNECPTICLMTGAFKCGLKTSFHIFDMGCSASNYHLMQHWFTVDLMKFQWNLIKT